MTRAHGTSRPDVMEMFPSSPALSWALEQAGWLVSDSVGYEGPLSEGFCSKIADRLLSERPRLVLLAYPEGLFGGRSDSPPWRRESSREEDAETDGSPQFSQRNRRAAAEF